MNTFDKEEKEKDLKKLQDMDPYTTSPYKIVEIIDRKQNSPVIKF